MYTHYPDSITSTLYPVTYRNQQASAASLLVNVYIAGTNVGAYHAASAGATSAGPYFDLDVMGFCAANVAPYVRAKSSVFGTLNDYYRSLATDCFRELYVTAFPETISSAGYLVTSTAADTSSASYIIPADFYGTTYSMNQFRQSGAGDMYFLTAYRGPREMRPAQNCYLSYLTKGLDAAQFTFHNAAGGTVSSCVVDLVHLPTDNTMQTISVGLANILGQTVGGGLVFHAGGFPSTVNFAYYTVSLGTYSGTYTRESEVLRFDVVGDCNDQVELHWFGKHGGAESLVICGGRVDVTKVSGDQVSIPQPWSVIGSPRRNPYDKGVIRTDTSSEPQTRITCAVSPEIAEYLSTLFSSPEIYLIQAGQYRAVAIENGTFKTGDNNAVSIEVDFTIVYPENQTPQL